MAVRKKLKNEFTHLFVLLALILSACLANAETQWKTLAPGLAYTVIDYPDKPTSKIHIFKINLAKYKLKLVTKAASNGVMNLRRLVLNDDTVLGINGGFFTEKSDPIGLRMQNREIINPLKKVSWFGVFYIKNHHPKIVAHNQFKPEKEIEFAIQAGPRLIINGQIPKLKPGIADRTALGITREGSLIILATDHLKITTTELAKMMKASAQENGLSCTNALNLDGGSSTQLYAKTKDFYVGVPSFRQPSDVILVQPRNVHEIT